MSVRQDILRTLLGLALLPSAGAAADPATVEFETGWYKAATTVEPNSTDPGTLQVARKEEGDHAGTQTRMLPRYLRHVGDVREAHSKLLVVGRTRRLNDLLLIYQQFSFWLMF